MTPRPALGLAHNTTLVIDLILGGHLQILGEGRWVVYTSGVCDTKPAISLKRSSLGQTYYTVSIIETRVRPISWWLCDL